MKRFHVHVHVQDLPKSIAFYSHMFGAEPLRVQADYAKWHLEDPRLNFAISARGGEPGVDHLGFQVDSEDELVELKDRAKAADMSLLDEGETACCYSRSDKYWLTDPDGVAWEQFHTLATIPSFGKAHAADAAPASACCAADSPRGKPVGIPVRAPSPCC
jgi:catechol 2,3-dioxygenase-like lactoylglutathione lyase family enzyme